MTTVSGSFQEREQALLTALQESGRVALEQDLHRIAMDAIEKELKNRLPPLSGTARATLEDELTYLDNNKDRMRYAGLARRGLPLGSGVTESAAKTVINQRAKGAGQRWKERGLRGVLATRSIVQSDRMQAFRLHFSRT